MLYCTLFLVAMNGIVRDLPVEVKATLYVNDLAIYMAATHTLTAERKLQLAINRVSKCAKDHGYNLAHSKTTGISYSQKRGRNTIPQLHLNGHLITLQKSVKFLGIFFDCKLTFRTHIATLKEKTIKKMNMLIIIAHLSWGGDRRSLVRIY